MNENNEEGETETAVAAIGLRPGCEGPTLNPPDNLEAHLADDIHAHPTVVLTTELSDEARRCARRCDDVAAAAAIQALKAIDPSTAALVAAEVYGNNTEWLW